MSVSQFIHIEGLRRVARSNEPAWRNVSGITAEGMRLPWASNHVPTPANPRILFGDNPIRVGEVATAQADTATDPIGRKVRSDGIVLFGGVVSYPIAWSDVQTSTCSDTLRNWTNATLAWLQSTFSSTLASVVLHVDEKYPHLHFYVLPHKVGSQLDLTCHPGYNAREQTRQEMRARLRPEQVSNSEERKQIRSKIHNAGEKSYRLAMSACQDNFHGAVSQHFNHMRFGPKRFRVERALHEKSRALDERHHEAIAILAQEKRLWADKIRKKLEALEEIRASRLRARDARIEELEAELAELKEQLAPSNDPR
ncbi:plasmid recombination protein [Stappia indica]|uniref:plasmid recombination protein n=1 Tax=Stappia indica TaxID=538381 RepID=UPI001CD599F2|nr:plasmid recombination protein [Stappia indica]MCA1300423.1 plasmid recombination protein [Stappia indica]